MHVPPTTTYRSGRFIMLCGEDLLASFILEPGDKRSDVDAWAKAMLTKHGTKTPRPCQRMLGGNWCYGQSHSECIEA